MVRWMGVDVVLEHVACLQRADLTADRASILDCQDASRSGEINRDTCIIQKAGSAHTAVAAVLRRDVHGTWRVTEARYLPDPC